MGGGLVDVICGWDLRIHALLFAAWLFSLFYGASFYAFPHHQRAGKPAPYNTTNTARHLRVMAWRAARGCTAYYLASIMQRRARASALLSLYFPFSGCICMRLSSSSLFPYLYLYISTIRRAPYKRCYFALCNPLSQDGVLGKDVKGPGELGTT